MGEALRPEGARPTTGCPGQISGGDRLAQAGRHTADPVDAGIARRTMYLIGLCLAERGERREAIAQFQKTERMFRNKPEGWNALVYEGDLLLQSNRNDEARGLPPGVGSGVRGGGLQQSLDVAGRFPQARVGLLPVGAGPPGFSYRGGLVPGIVGRFSARSGPGTYRPDLSQLGQCDLHSS